MSPTLVVGLGGTGRVVVERTKRKLERMLGASWVRESGPSSLQYLTLDTASMEEPEETNRPELRQALDGESEAILLGVTKERRRAIDRQLRSGSTGEDLSWLRDVGPGLWSDDAYGVRANRALGRLMFLENVEDHGDSARLRAVMRTKLERLGRSTGKPSSRYALIVTSLAGGTGSGMMLDCAALLRTLQPRLRIWLVALLPEVIEGQKDIFSRADEMRATTYAALKELDTVQRSVGSRRPWTAQPRGSTSPLQASRLFDRVFLVEEHPLRRWSAGTRKNIIRVVSGFTARCPLGLASRVDREVPLPKRPKTGGTAGVPAYHSFGMGILTYPQQTATAGLTTRIKRDLVVRLIGATSVTEARDTDLHLHGSWLDAFRPDASSLHVTKRELSQIFVGDFNEIQPRIPKRIDAVLQIGARLVEETRVRQQAWVSSFERRCCERITETIERYGLGAATSLLDDALARWEVLREDLRIRALRARDLRDRSQQAWEASRQSLDGELRELRREPFALYAIDWRDVHREKTETVLRQAVEHCRLELDGAVLEAGAQALAALSMDGGPLNRLGIAIRRLQHVSYRVKHDADVAWARLARRERSNTYGASSYPPDRSLVEVVSEKFDQLARSSRFDRVQAACMAEVVGEVYAPELLGSMKSQPDTLRERLHAAADRRLQEGWREAYTSEISVASIGPSRGYQASVDLVAQESSAPLWRHTCANAQLFHLLFTNADRSTCEALLGKRRAREVSFLPDYRDQISTLVCQVETGVAARDFPAIIERCAASYRKLVDRYPGLHCVPNGRFFAEPADKLSASTTQEIARLIEIAVSLRVLVAAKTGEWRLRQGDVPTASSGGTGYRKIAASRMALVEAIQTNRRNTRNRFLDALRNALESLSRKDAYRFLSDWSPSAATPKGSEPALPVLVANHMMLRGIQP